MKVIGNPTDEPCCIWWGHTPYQIPARSAIVVENAIADTCLPHDDYKKLEIVDPEGESHEMVAKQYMKGPELGPETRPETTKTAPVRDTQPEDVDPEWDPLECNYEEIETYVEKHNLVINPDLDEDAVRQLVDEHSQN